MTSTHKISLGISASTLLGAIALGVACPGLFSSGCSPG